MVCILVALTSSVWRFYLFNVSVLDFMLAGLIGACRGLYGVFVILGLYFISFFVGIVYIKAL